MGGLDQRLLRQKYALPVPVFSWSLGFKNLFKLLTEWEDVCVCN